MRHDSRRECVVWHVGVPALIVSLCLSVKLHAHESDEHAADPAKPPTVSLAFEASHMSVPTVGSEIFLRARVKAVKRTADTRQPLNLAIVFDRSGSMKEESKIGYLRQAGHLLSDNLTRQDHVAFVAYNHQVQVLVPMHPVVNREYLHHRLDELTAEGQTNLSGGLLEGCAQLKKRIEEAGLHHVILLTDGLANRGVTDKASLVQLARQCTGRGITLTTMGVGTDYNEELLGELAQAGSGRYVYVSDPDKIPIAFERELGSLVAVVAQNATLRIPLPSVLQATQIFGREDPITPGHLEIPLGDLPSGQEQVILIKLRANAIPSTAIELPLTMTYDDIAAGERVEEKQAVLIQASSTGSSVDDKNPVIAYARVVESIDKIALAVRSMDRRLAAEVLDIQTRKYPKWKQLAIDSRDQEFYNKAFMFEHYARELQHLIDSGALHEHSEVRAQLQKELHYRRYLMHHHGHPH